MDRFQLHDSNPLSSSSHTVEMKRGFDTAARLMVEKRESDWWVYGVHTKDAYRGNGLARQLLAYVESNYGPVAIESENDPFWQKMGYVPGNDGFWRRPQS